MVLRTPAALLVGAGGTVALMETDAGEQFRSYYRLLSNLAGAPNDPKSKGGSDSGLAGEIEGLKRMMRDSNRRDVVVVNRGSGSWSLMGYGVLFAGLGLAYLRFWKGWRLGDLMYVSQATLKASTGALKQGMESLKEVTQQAKEYLQSRLDGLECAQAEHMEKTERIDNNISELGGTVDEMHDELSEVGTNVKGMQGQLGEIQDAQTYNSRGIFLLLKVVGELAHSNNFKLKNELDQFSREPPPLPVSSSTPGLEGLLMINGSESMQPIDPTGHENSSPGQGAHHFEEITPDGASQSSSQATANPNPKPTPRVITRSGSKGVAGLGSLKR